MKIEILHVLKAMLSNDEKSIDEPDLRKLEVAAGDPAKRLTARSISKSVELTDKDSERIKGLKVMRVCGNSMYPCGIANGDIIYTEAYTERNERKANDFYVLETDKGYYDYKRKKLRYDYKLRRYLMDIPTEMELCEIYERLFPLNGAIILEEKKKLLARKLQETRAYYKNVMLCLSITFDNGDLRYSFHPASLIRYKVRFIVSSKQNNLVEADLVSTY